MAQAGFRSYLGFWLGGLSSGVTVSQQVDVVIGGAGFPVYYNRKHRIKRREIDVLLDRVVEELYEDLLATDKKDVIAKAAKIVKPFAEDNRKIPLQIDWAKLEDDLTKVKALLALWEEEILENDDEEVLFLLQ